MKNYRFFFTTPAGATASASFLSGTEAHSFEKYESRLFLMMTTTTNGGDGGTGRVLRNPNSLDEKRLSVKFCNVKIKAQKKKRPQVHVSFVL